MTRWLLLLMLILAPVRSVADDKIDERADAIVLAGAEHALWHAVGGLLLGPIDADDFAVLQMTTGGDAVETERLLDVAGLWITAPESANAAAAWLKREGMTPEAGRRLICFVAGEGPGRAHRLVARWGPPKTGARTCTADLSERLDKMAAKLKAGKALVSLSYAPGSWHDWLKGREILERVAQRLTELNLGRHLTLAAGPCGAAEVRVEAKTGKITLCHELLDAYDLLADSVK